jgi:hypothetical protein
VQNIDNHPYVSIKVATRVKNDMIHEIRCDIQVPDCTGLEGSSDVSEGIVEGMNEGIRDGNDEGMLDGNSDSGIVTKVKGDNVTSELVFFTVGADVVGD